MFEEELKVYDSNVNSWEMHRGKYVIICGSDIHGFWDTWEDAIQAGYMSVGLKQFLVEDAIQAGYMSVGLKQFLVKQVLVDNTQYINNSFRVVLQIKNAIEEWSSKQGHDSCWYYPDIFKQIATLVGAEVSSPTLPAEEEFKKGCCKYQEELYPKKIFQGFEYSVEWFESKEFIVLAGCISGVSTLINYIENTPAYKALNRQHFNKIYTRYIELASKEFDINYANPYDSSLCAYCVYLANHRLSSDELRLVNLPLPVNSPYLRRIIQYYE